MHLTAKRDEGALHEQKTIGRNRRIAVLCVMVAAMLATAAPSHAGELWGAYTGYNFDEFRGDDGYGLSWNYSDAESAGAQAVKVCRERQPPLPLHDPARPGVAPGERCGDVIFAFSTAGPSAQKYTAVPDPAWGEDFEKLFVWNKASRCVAVFEQSNHWEGYEVLGSGFSPIWGDAPESIIAVGEQQMQREIPYRVSRIACNDS